MYLEKLLMKVTIYFIPVIEAWFTCPNTFEWTNSKDSLGQTLTLCMVVGGLFPIGIQHKLYLYELLNKYVYPVFEDSLASID